MKGGYDSIYLGLIPRLSDCDFHESADRLGGRYVTEGVHLTFLKRDYRITKQGAEVLDGQPVNINNLSVLVYYILSKGRGDPEHSYIRFESIPRFVGGLSGQNRLMSAPLERYFAEDYANFADAARKLGGIEIEFQTGKHSWIFDVLPKIPLKIDFYEADEDFPVEIQILLDKTAPHFLEFECLAFMVGCFVHTMIRTAQHGDVVGWE